ncbi:MAG TPA: biotin carboxylase N-terminal domain-containing protein [Streptosporangiaceae bacterium]|jgi:acetyl-CoA carboxylase biotin carboxylase subunit
MLHRVLIANRGEIAVRIVRACHRLGIEAVLAASEADLESLPARLADRTVCLGPAAPAGSYLDTGAVLAAARQVAADAIHPGYGFLSENPGLARACEAAGLAFIGPAASVLDAAGDKLAARDHAAAAGLPVLPGGEARNLAGAQRVAEQAGWPVLVKAVGGGGGRGLRQVHHPRDLATAIGVAMAEAQAAFGDPRIYLERFVSGGRHVEVQLLGDGSEVIGLGDRDCSVQRRYQKLIEEAPAPGLADGLRSALGEAAVALGRRLGYRGLGTVEFLLDPGLGEFYFLEVNARIQVEHPVTEAVTGLDLVAEQLRLADGGALRLAPGDVTQSGHAIECRINAEDWRHGFRPSPGTVTRAVFPAGPGIRVDTWVQAGTVVPPYYDSLLAKLVTSGPDRASALDLLRRALAACDIGGVTTNLPLHTALTGEPEFAASAVDTGYLERFLARDANEAALHG